MFKLKVETDNAAFHDDETGEYVPEAELADILERVKIALRTGVDGEPGFGVVLDGNGNRVGWWQLGEG